MNSKKILYLVTEDWYFCSHRLPVARGAHNAGMDVVVATRVSDHRSEIENEGFKLIPLGLRREGRNPFTELLFIIELVKIYRREKPDIVHHVALKPILYGSLAALLSGVPHIINAFTGLGYIFMGKSILQRLLRLTIIPIMRILLSRNNSHLIVQSIDDLKLLQQIGIGASEHTTLIPGSGVDIEHFKPVPEPGGPITVALVGRMLWDKGVGEFVEAARILHKKGEPIRAILVGTPDPANPKSIPEATLRAWELEGLIEWRGFEKDVRKIWANAHIAVLPSYREGMPKSLLEAAAMGRPLVAADAPGCRDLIKNGENGILVKVGDALSLADAIELLAKSPDERLRLGDRAREIVEGAYSADAISQQTSELYLSLINK